VAANGLAAKIAQGFRYLLAGVVQVLGWPPREGPRRVTFPGAALAAEVVDRYERRFGIPPAGDAEL